MLGYLLKVGAQAQQEYEEGRLQRGSGEGLLAHLPPGPASSAAQEEDQLAAVALRESQRRISAAEAQLLAQLCQVSPFF